MKYGAMSFVKKDGRTSARRTTDLGTFGPTRSRAAESIITYRTLFISPNSQNATSTDASAPWKIALNRALYNAHDEPGEPGIGSSPDDDGDLFIVCRRLFPPNMQGTERSSSGDHANMPECAASEAKRYTERINDMQVGRRRSFVVFSRNRAGRYN